MNNKPFKDTTNIYICSDQNDMVAEAAVRQEMVVMFAGKRHECVVSLLDCMLHNNHGRDL